MAAIRDDDTETVRRILENGLDPNSVYNEAAFYAGDAGLTLMHWAARFGSPGSTEVLCSNFLGFQ